MTLIVLAVMLMTGEYRKFSRTRQVDSTVDHSSEEKLEATDSETDEEDPTLEKPDKNPFGPMPIENAEQACE